MLPAPKEASRSSHRQATARRGLRSTERAAQRVPHPVPVQPEAGRLRLAADDRGRRAHQDRAGHRADRFVPKAAMQALHPAQVLPVALPEVPEPTEV